MLLQGKNALIFAASGAIASGVAERFAREGATVWLSARNAAKLEPLALRIRDVGGTAHMATLDATDDAAIADYVAGVARKAGSVDIHFNGIGGRPEELGYPERATEVSPERFMLPLTRIVASTFLTARACARPMIAQKSGAIVTLSATLSGMTAAHMPGITAACGAIEALTRSLAGEFGPHGVRVNCVRGSAMPETRTIQETFAGQARLRGGEGGPMNLPPLGRMISVADTANTAAFLASAHAGGMTGQVVTVCAGAFVGQG